MNFGIEHDYFASLHQIQFQLHSFWEMLERCGDERVNHREGFMYTVINPRWSKVTHDPDSGLVAMRLIDVLGEPEAELDMLRLHEVLHEFICNFISLHDINVNL